MIALIFNIIFNFILLPLILISALFCGSWIAEKLKNKEARQNIIQLAALGLLFFILLSILAWRIAGVL
jgi:hypothetical protein